jgi:DNA-binding transcriptional LysR family regulator
MNRGGLGARSLNIELQNALNPLGEIRLPWIGYETGMSALPQARWIAARRGARGSPVALNDAAAILHAVSAGIGRSLLPCFIADHHPALHRQDLPDLPEPPSRELWLLTHPDQRELARISAVQMWLDHTLDAAGLVG